MKALTFTLSGSAGASRPVAADTRRPGWAWASATSSDQDRPVEARVTVGDIFRVCGRDVQALSSTAAAAFRPRGGWLDGGRGSRHRRCRGAGRTRHARRTRSSKATRARMRDRACAAAGWKYCGNAGDHLGAPLAGELAGMNGGVLIVRGQAGAFAADRMRRGLIAVLSGCGDYAGSRMIAGTLVVARRRRRDARLSDAARLDPSRPRTGKPVAELCRMWHAGPRFAVLLDRHLIAERIIKRPLLGRGAEGGDNAVLGMGEILFPAR